MTEAIQRWVLTRVGNRKPDILFFFLCKRSGQHVGLSVLYGRKERHGENEDVDTEPKPAHFLTSTHDKSLESSRNDCFLISVRCGSQGLSTLFSYLKSTCVVIYWRLCKSRMTLTVSNLYLCYKSVTSSWTCCGFSTSHWKISMSCSQGLQDRILWLWLWLWLLSSYSGAWMKNIPIGNSWELCLSFPVICSYI